MNKRMRGGCSSPTMKFLSKFLGTGCLFEQQHCHGEELIVGPETEPLFIHIVMKPPHCFNITSPADCLALYE